MSEFEQVRQRKLQKEVNGSAFRRTISIEADGTEYTVKIDDSRLTVNNYGLIDPNKRGTSSSNTASTTKSTPAMALCNKLLNLQTTNFDTDMQHEHLQPLPAGMDFAL